MVESQPRARFDPSKVRNIRTEEEQEMRSAVTILVKAGLVETAYLDQHRADIDLPKWEIDAIIWKQKRRLEAYQSANGEPQSPVGS